MKPPVPVLHVMNNTSDASISRIVARIIMQSDKDEFAWHVSGVSGLGEMEQVYRELGARVIDFSPQANHGMPPKKTIGRYIVDQEIQILHSHTPRTIMDSWRGIHAARFGVSKKPIHLATKHVINSPFDRKNGWIYFLIDQFTLFLPDHLVPVSRTMAREIAQLPGLSEAKITAISNAIPCENYYLPQERENARKLYCLEADMVAIGFTGRLSQVKRLDLLLEAFAETIKVFPRVHLLIAGNGELHQQLEQQTHQLGIASKVTWMGFYKNIPRFLSALDIYVQPSINEGLSLSILEAMAAGLPVIATRVGSAEEIIEDGQTGILIHPKSTLSIEAALIKLLENPEMRNHIAENARQSVLAHYNIQKMTASYLQLYRNLLGNILS